MNWDDSELLFSYEKTNVSNTVTNCDLVVGKVFRVTYLKDNFDYEAVIIDVSDSNNVLVRFLGYENEQLVSKADLKPSHGPIARTRQEIESRISLENKPEDLFDKIPFPEILSDTTELDKSIAEHIKKHLKNQ